MDYETLRFKIADGVAIITLDRKENPANALNARMGRAFEINENKKN